MTGEGDLRSAPLQHQSLTRYFVTYITLDCDKPCPKLPDGRTPAPVHCRKSPARCKSNPYYSENKYSSPIVAGLWGLATRNHLTQLKKPQEARWTEECVRAILASIQVLRGTQQRSALNELVR